MDWNFPWLHLKASLSVSVNELRGEITQEIEWYLVYQLNEGIKFLNPLFLCVWIFLGVGNRLTLGKMSTGMTRFIGKGWFSSSPKLAVRLKHHLIMKKCKCSQWLWIENLYIWNLDFIERVRLGHIFFGLSPSATKQPTCPNSADG